MPRLYLTRNLKTYQGDTEKRLDAFLGDVQSILQDLENQINANPAIWTRLGTNSPFPQAPQAKDVLLDYSSGSFRIGLYDGNEWVYITLASLDGSTITEDQHGALGRETTDGNPLHTSATTTEPGFMSDSDKTKLDGIASGATATPLSNATPETQVLGDSGTAGISTSASRSDHKHPVTALSDITHGSRGGGTLHADATTIASGFQNAADKVKSDHFLGKTTSTAAPSVTEYPASGDYGFHEDTMTSTRYWAYNDGGTVFSAVLT